MSFSKTNPAGWSLGATLTSAQCNDIDLKTSQALDKVGGDSVGTGVTITWASGSTLAIASGAGIVSSGGALTFNTSGGATWNTGTSATFSNGSTLSVSGAVTVQTAGTVDLRGVLTVDGSGGGLGKIQTNQPGLIVLGGGTSDWIQFSAPRTITRVHLLSESPILVTSGFSLSHLGLTSTGTGATISIPLVEMVDGATLSKVEVFFTPASAHAAQPAVLPGVIVQRRTINTGIAYPGTTVDLNSTSTQSFAWVSLADYNNGNGHAIVYTPNQNNVIDRTQYAYYALITDESGANAIAGAQYFGLRYTFSVPQFAYA